jgi:hypothetical protein
MTSFTTGEPIKYSACFKKDKARCGIRFESQSSSESMDHDIGEKELLLNETQEVVERAKQVSVVTLPPNPKEMFHVASNRPKASTCSTSLFFPPTETSNGGVIWCLDDGSQDDVTVIGDLWSIYIEQTASSIPFKLPYSFVNC